VTNSYSMWWICIVLYNLPPGHAWKNQTSWPYWSLGRVLQ
jgi:hypothetical protein